MPHGHPLEAPVGEAEHLAGQVEHAGHYSLEREVGGHFVGVDAEALPADGGVQVAKVPGLHRAPAGGGGEVVELGA